MTLKQIKERISALEKDYPGDTETNVNSVSVGATPLSNFTGLEPLISFRLRDVLCVKTVTVD